MRGIYNNLAETLNEEGGISPQKILNINIQRKFTITLQIAFPLCIVLSDDKLLPWFYENYMIICGYKDDSKYALSSDIFIHDRLFYKYIDNHIMDYSFIDNNQFRYISDSMKLVLTKINSDYYVIAFLDEYYIDGRDAASSYHYKHEFLLYGYDLGEEIFYVVSFFNKAFTNFTITFQQFLDGIQSEEGHRDDINWMNEKVIMFVKPLPYKEVYPFSLKDFANKLGDLLESKISEKDLYYMRLYRRDIDSKMLYGMDVYEVIDNYMERMIDNVLDMPKEKFNTLGNYTADRYRIFHAFSEHRNGLMERFLFIGQQFDMPVEYQSCLERYNEILKYIKIITVKYRKLIFQKENYTMEEIKLKIKEVFSDMKEIVEIIKQKESSILKEIYEIIAQYNSNTINK